VIPISVNPLDDRLKYLAGQHDAVRGLATVTMVIGRSAKVLVTGALAGLLLAGCASGPGQAGSAAIVNGNAISLDSVQSELNNFLANPPAAAAGQQIDGPTEARAILSYSVLDQIDTAAVARYHLNIPPQALSELTEAEGGLDKAAKTLGYSTAETQMILRDQVVQLVYANQYVSKFQVNYDELTMPSQSTANTLAQKLAADPANARSVLTSAATAVGGQPVLGGKFTGGQIIDQQSQAEQQAQQGGQQAPSILPLFAAKSNSVLTFPLDQADWAVLVVHSADTNGKPSASDLQALSQADPNVLYQSGLFLLTSLAQSMNIKISPRYGVWDSIGMKVVGAAGQSGSQYPNKTAPAAS
jgi:hypothetical protein